MNSINTGQGLVFSHTVNVVIFAGGKFRETVGKTFQGGGLFSQYYSYFLHKGIWVLFSHGSNSKCHNYPHAKISTFTVFTNIDDGIL